MPLLNRKRMLPEPGTQLDKAPESVREYPWAEPEPAAPGSGTGLFETCANPQCATGWMRLWRSRSGPIFEGGWNCSPACTSARVETALRREMDGWRAAPEMHRHRIPLGLVMLEQGWITHAQLRRAVEAQKTAGGGRLGQWLIRHQAATEEQVTRALGLQWSCPVLGLEFHDPDALTPLVPRLFLDAFGALPLRIAAGRLIYLGFQDRLDPVLALAVERMTGLRVECGVVRGSAFGAEHTRMLAAKFPRVELIEAVSEQAMVRAFARALERARPVASRLVRVHDCLWLRMFSRAPSGALANVSTIQDVIGLIGLR